MIQVFQTANNKFLIEFESGKVDALKLMADEFNCKQTDMLRSMIIIGFIVPVPYMELNRLQHEDKV